MDNVVMPSATPIPIGCICAYTWHSDGSGRIVRNGPLASCLADHTEVDGG